jgi:hypothetical protein
MNENATNAMKVTDIQSSHIPNHRVDAMKRYHDDVCMSWKSSKARMKDSSALNARIVVKPYREVDRCENTGERAGYFRCHGNNVLF